MSAETDISFSVVIPVYNGSATVCRAVNSALNQTVRPLEIIVSDDCSTDDTISLLQSTFGSRITVLKAMQNKGSAAARNRGMDAARGSYVAFLDADDEWHEQKLEQCALALQMQPRATLLYHSYRLYTDVQPAFSLAVEPRALSMYRLLKGNCIVTSCAVLRLDSDYRFDARMRHTEDYDLWLRITSGGGVFEIPHTLTMLHRPVTSPGGISSNVWAMRKGELVAYTHLVRYHVAWALLLPFLWVYSLTKHLFRSVGWLKKGVSYSKQQ